MTAGKVVEVSGAKIINLTPHTITIQVGGSVVEVEPSGVTWRLEEEDVRVGEVGGIKIVKRSFRLTSAPFNIDDVDIVIVSLPLLLTLKSALGVLPERPRICAPDTGSGAIRDEKGNVRGTTQLITL
jgi:hypothetical protein